MKRNRLLGTAAALWVVVVLGVCFLPGTLARYASAGSGSGGAANVAEWDPGVVVTGWPQGQTFYLYRTAAYDPSANLTLPGTVVLQFDNSRTDVSADYKYGLYRDYYDTFVFQGNYMLGNGEAGGEYTQAANQPKYPETPGDGMMLPRKPLPAGPFSGAADVDKPAWGQALVNKSVIFFSNYQHVDADGNPTGLAGFQEKISIRWTAVQAD